MLILVNFVVTKHLAKLNEEEREWELVYTQLVPMYLSFEDFVILFPPPDKAAPLLRRRFRVERIHYVAGMKDEDLRRMKVEVPIEHMITQGYMRVDNAYVKKLAGQIRDYLALPKCLVLSENGFSFLKASYPEVHLEEKDSHPLFSTITPNSGIFVITPKTKIYLSPPSDFFQAFDLPSEKKKEFRIEIQLPCCVVFGPGLSKQLDRKGGYAHYFAAAGQFPDPYTMENWDSEIFHKVNALISSYKYLDWFIQNVLPSLSQDAKHDFLTKSLTKTLLNHSMNSLSRWNYFNVRRIGETPDILNFPLLDGRIRDYFVTQLREASKEGKIFSSYTAAGNIVDYCLPFFEMSEEMIYPTEEEGSRDQLFKISLVSRKYSLEETLSELDIKPSYSCILPYGMTGITNTIIDFVNRFRDESEICSNSQS